MSRPPSHHPPPPPERRYTLTPSMTVPRGELADDVQAVFAAAIDAGVLSRDPASPNYAGEWMYMHHHDGKAAFKHRTTREYRFLPI